MNKKLIFSLVLFTFACTPQITLSKIRKCGTTSCSVKRVRRNTLDTTGLRKKKPGSQFFKGIKKGSKKVGKAVITPFKLTGKLLKKIFRRR